MTPEKLHADDVSLPRSRKCLWLVESNFSCYDTTDQKQHTELGGDTSPVKNYFTFLKIISHGNQWWYREMLAAFLRLPSMLSCHLISLSVSHRTIICRSWKICSPLKNQDILLHLVIDNRTLTLSKQNVRQACLLGKLEFRLFSSTVYVHVHY